MELTSALQLAVVYYYEDARAYLDVGYNESANAVTIRAGRNGYAALAELLTGYALAPPAVTGDDWHWSPLTEGAPELVVNFVGDFGKELDGTAA